jgi:hypothetical protein
MVVGFLRLGIGCGAIGLGVSGLLTFLLAAGRLSSVINELRQGQFGFSQELELIGIVDLFLLGVGILVIAAGIVSLTITRVIMPKGLQFTDLHHLKSTFSSFLILIMAILYLESLSSLRSLESTTHSNPIALLYAGLGFLAVTIALVIFQRSGSHHKNGSRGGTGSGEELSHG